MEPTSQEIAALGFAYAGFIVSAATIVALEKRGILTAEDARNIFYDARVALARPEAFPGDSRAVEFADMALRNAENLLDLVAAQERTAGPD
jgi:hypothetical protein